MVPGLFKREIHYVLIATKQIRIHLCQGRRAIPVIAFILMRRGGLIKRRMENMSSKKDKRIAKQAATGPTLRVAFPACHAPSAMPRIRM